MVFVSKSKSPHGIKAQWASIAINFFLSYYSELYKCKTNNTHNFISFIIYFIYTTQYRYFKKFKHNFTRERYQTFQ